MGRTGPGLQRGRKGQAHWEETRGQTREWGSRARPSPPGPGQTAGPGPGVGPGLQGPGGPCAHVWGEAAGLRPLQAGAVPRQGAQGRGLRPDVVPGHLSQGQPRPLSQRTGVHGTRSVPCRRKEKQGRHAELRGRQWGQRERSPLEESERSPRAEAWEPVGGHRGMVATGCGAQAWGAFCPHCLDSVGCPAPRGSAQTCRRLQVCTRPAPASPGPGRWAPGVWAHVYRVPAAVRPGRSRPCREEEKGVGGAMGPRVVTAVTNT